ncbi:hypothetical protein AQJ43_37300 [Streptomyces avermitilis]|uniref:hypothetical protein n=1 Tax=Streptomyces TaxID=1883 RepID=UPI00030EC224|nr:MULTISPECIES: hypothetical protein [Streptomyces]KUN46977.1 hypothetical protein AQJ43_37300 [Streptomyces avermitilis]MYS96613.1 hypothetical protein [Streptomyces sp. SID5469]OOV21240.1 hypothetical protein SM007_34750 [Streptomyces avermitilis]
MTAAVVTPTTSSATPSTLAMSASHVRDGGSSPRRTMIGRSGRNGLEAEIAQAGMVVRAATAGR